MPALPSAPAGQPDKIKDLTGQIVAERYRVEARIGTGAMGAVYRVEHVHMRKPFALKVLHARMADHAETVARFEREAQAAGGIEHPNICRAFDFGRLRDGSSYMVMEYLEGTTLRRKNRTLDRIPVERAIRIARQLASALGAAHAHGIVHRDLKPENIMLIERDGERDFVKVMDFGLAALIPGEAGGERVRLTMAGVVYGTPVYMSPEQASAADNIDGRADLYALGAMLFEMVTGSVPYSGKTVTKLLSQHLSAPVPSIRQRVPDANLPAYLDAIITRLMAKKPSARFQTAAELIEALDRQRAGDELGAYELRSVRARSARIAIGAALLLALIAAGAYLLSANPGRPLSDLPGLSAAAVEQATAELAAERDDFVKGTSGFGAILETMASGDPDAAVIALGRRKAEFAESPHFYYYLGVAHHARGDAESALSAAAAAIDRDERYAAEERVVAEIIAAIASGDDALDERARALLTPERLTKIAPRLAQAAYSLRGRKRRRRVIAYLKESKQWSALPTWRRAAIELRNARGCSPRIEPVRALGEADDPAALEPLREYAAKPKVGCGKSKKLDCYACLRDELAASIANLEARFPRAALADPPAAGADADDEADELE